MSDLSTNRIGVGVIGASPGNTWASLAHLPALAALPELRIVAVSTTKQATADETARRYDVPYAFDRAAPLVEHPDVDVVVVSVRAPEHAPLVRAALAAKKHVFCEWPVGPTLATTIELAALAREAGVHTVAGLQRRFAPSLVHLRNLLADGYIGELRSIHVHVAVPLLGATRPAAYAYTADVDNGANVLHTLTAHFLDTALSVVGEPASFSALVARQFSETTLLETGEPLPVTAPDQVAVIGTLASGALLSVRVEGGKRNGARITWTLTGTEGDLEVGDDFSLRGARGDGQPLAPIALPGSVVTIPKGALSDDAHQIAHLYASLAHALRGCERHPLLPSFDDAVRLRHLLEAFRASSETGRRLEWSPGVRTH